MRVQSCRIENFASYKEVDFSFDDKGLILIHGATGSGKSTLCDVIPWCLFGRTAKGGTVDEILSWPGTEVTKATIWLDKVTISRSRGPKPKDNDLTFWPADGVVTRGKDLNDTQKMINNLLGIDSELYLSGAYFHEFSQTAQFFTTTPKNRRTICEQLVDLSLAKNLQDKSSIELKANTKELDKITNEIKICKSDLSTLERVQSQEANRQSEWDSMHKLRIAKVEASCLRFEDNRSIRIKQIIEESSKKAKSKVCSECGTVKTQITHTHQDNSIEIKRIENEENPYLVGLQELQAEINPHTSGAKDYSDEISKQTNELKELEVVSSRIQTKISDLETLQNVIQSFRSELIQNTIQDLENKTNLLLSNHFDAEIKVTLSIQDSDKLDVSITKDSNICSFTQLSKGQRQILKLCFGVSVMKCVSNHHGVNFSQIFLDESTDGMDDNTKMKAVKMLESLALEYDSIYLVEHSSEIKAIIGNKYRVELVNGQSQIEKT